MEIEDTETIEKVCSSLLCHVCGDKARGMNFDVISCMSCKMFFRRNALRPRDTLQCARKSHCKITIVTRAMCGACRLRKCFVVGMKSHLIRSFYQPCLPAPQPISLLMKDRSTLTSEQWNLLSNVIHAYDEQNFPEKTKSYLDAGSCLPMKMRVKQTFAFDLMQKCLTDIQILVNKSPNLQLLNANVRQLLFHRNSFWIMLFKSFLVSRQINYFTNLNFVLSFSAIYGSNFLEKVDSVFKQMDSDEVIHKMMIFIIIFSSNSSIVTFNPSDHIGSTTVLADVVRIQDIYVTVLWKYLIHQYGFEKAVLRYSSLIKLLINGYWMLETMGYSKMYEQMLKKTAEQMESSLVIEE